MKLFQTTPAEDAKNIRGKLAEARAALTAAENAEVPARDALRRAAAAGEPTDPAAKRLEEHRAAKERAAALVTELEHALRVAEEHLTAAEKDADLEALRATATAAMKDGEKAAAEGVKALRTLILAWGRIEAARETVDRCSRRATRRFEAELGVNPTLPNKYQLVPLAVDGLSGGRMCYEDLDGLGFYLPDPK